MQSYALISILAADTRMTAQAVSSLSPTTKPVLCMVSTLSPHSPPLHSPSALPVSPHLTPQSPPALALSDSDIADLEHDIGEMQRKFEDLVDSVEASFQSNQVPLEKLKGKLKHIPMSLKLQLGKFFRDQTSEILKAESLGELFIMLSYNWNYLNPGLLEFMVGRFGSKDDILSMEAYLRKLDCFRTRVKVGDYIRTSYAKGVDCNEYYYKQIIAKMQEEAWEEKTLQDVENFKADICKKYHFQPFLTQIHVSRSSIALVFTIPCWIEINMMDFEPLLRKNHAIQVYMNNYGFEPDGAKEVSIH